MESRLKPELARVTLLGQIPLTDRDAATLYDELRRAVARDFSEIKTDAPVAFSRYLVWVGARHFDAGTYWQAVEKEFHQHGTHRQREWGELFLATLRRHRLAVLPDTAGFRFVSPILLHGGIPDSDLPNFFEHVLEPLVSSGIELEVGDAEQIVAAWRESGTYEDTHQPVRRFLENGGKPAADFVSRCVEMAQAAQSREPLPTADELGLPESVVLRFEQWRSEPRQLLMREQHVHLNRPHLERDVWGEVRCVLPEQTLTAGREAYIQFQVIADGREGCDLEVPAYRTARGLITERAECETPPAQSYRMRLLSDARLLREWTVAGLNAAGWTAFDERGRLIRGSQLPRGLFWLVYSRELKLEAPAHVLEEASGAGDWERFHHRLIDATNAAQLALIRADGTCIDLPLASARAATLDAEPLPGCEANALPVYASELPALRVPLGAEDELDRWAVVVEDLTERAPTRKCVSLKEATADFEQGCAIVPLAQAALLGEPQFGIYRIKLRSRGALGSDQQLMFAFVRELRADFAAPLFLADETARLKLHVNSACRVLPEENGVSVAAHDDAVEIAVPAPYRRFTLRLQESARRELPLTFTVPRFRWALPGLANHSATGWLSAPLIIQREDFEASEDVRLVVQLPFDDGAECRLELEGTTHRSAASVRRGEVKLPLSPFRDSLSALAAPLARFAFSFTDATGSTRTIRPLIVRTRWLVTKFECRETHVTTVEWPRAAPSQQCRVMFHIEDEGRSRSRAIRLWNLLEPWQPPRHLAVPDGATDVALDELPAGRFRVELFTAEEFETSAPPLPPPRDDAGVFDLTLNEGEWLRQLRAPADSFRAQLSRRLAGAEGRCTPSTALTPRETDDLTYALLFLMNEGREGDIKRLWFDDLAQQIRQPTVRKAVRERLRIVAAHEPDENLPPMRRLCALIGLAVRSLIPFVPGAEVRFEEKAAFFRGIEEWESQSQRWPQAVDVLLVHHFDPRSRNLIPTDHKVPLTHVSKLTPLNERRSPNTASKIL